MPCSIFPIYQIFTPGKSPFREALDRATGAKAGPWQPLAPCEPKPLISTLKGRAGHKQWQTWECPKATHWVLILLVSPGLPDVPIIGGGPLFLCRTPLLPQDGLSLIFLPVQVGPVREAGSTHDLPEGTKGELGGSAQAQ